MKKQLKKSFSLFLAVLMLMTCWVWVAPQKASAADIKYPITINYTIARGDAEVDGGHIKAWYYKFDASGNLITSTAHEVVLVSSMKDWNEGSYSVTRNDIPGWVFKVEGYIDDNHISQDANLGFQSITIGDINVLNGGTFSFNNKTRGWSYNGTATEEDWGSATRNWPTPKFGVDKDKSDSMLDITAPPLPTSNTATNTGTANFKFKDVNYGVEWPSANVTQNTPTIKTKSGSTSTYMTATKSGSTATIVTAKAGADTVHPNQSDSDWVLTSSFTSGGVTSTMDVEILLTHPTYTVTFNANGGKLDPSDAAQIKDLLYNQKIGHVPTIGEFYGYQLAGFRDGQNGGTVLTADTLVKGNSTWYAWWEPADITVTFKTADNQTIGSLTSKYGKTITGVFGSRDAVNSELEKLVPAGTFVDGAPAWVQDGIVYQFNGWKVISATNLDGEPVPGLVSKMDNQALLEGDTVFQATYIPKDKKQYTISFYNAEGTEVSKKTDYYYGDFITNIPEVTLAEDVQYTYTHVGWAPKIGTTKYYTVDANDKDINGTTVVYTSKDTDSFRVEGNEEYVPVFRMENKEYTITFKYYEDGRIEKTATVEGVYYGDAIVAPEGIKDNYTYGGYRYKFDHWYDLENGLYIDNTTCLGNMTFTMIYQDPPEPAIYTINFYDRDGNLLNKGANTYEHDSDVKAPEIDQIIDTDEALYTFVAFKDKNGNTYSQTATADADYYAEYSEKVYADVTFYNEGVEIYKLAGKENGIFVGDKIPVYDVETYKTPEKAEDAVGTYTFSGWADGSGKVIVPGTDTFTGDIYLHAQYTTNYKDYTVIFQNDDGTELSKKTYHYGAEIEFPAEPTKAEDESYVYSFRAWEPDVSEVCYGNATYTASYRRSQKTYPVVWMKDDKTAANTVNYHYGERILTPGTPDPVVAGEPGAGYTWILNEWIRCNAAGQPIDADGNVVAEAAAERYVRGIQMGTTPLFFYPTYKKEALVHTVEFYNEDGTTLIGTAQIPHDESIKDYDDEFIDGAIKEATSTQHFIFANWVKLDGAAIDKITGDVEVKATYTPEAHNKKIYEIVKAPTCTETGLVNMKCEADTCGLIDYNVVEPVIPDFSAPIGQVQLGSNVWKLEDYSSVNYDDVVYVGPSTKGVISATDTNAASEPWNPDGKITRRVGKIEYYVSKEVVAAPSTISTWETAYDYDSTYAAVFGSALVNAGLTKDQFDALDEDNSTKKEILGLVNATMANYEANPTSNISDLNLTDGEEYIVYIRISDREVNGTSNKAYFSTGKFHYGSTAPEITIRGEGYGAEFCAEATITVTDDLDGVKVLLDGEEITLTGGKYTTTEKGVHSISATDKSGNTTTRTFEIKGSHSYRNYTVAPTCDKAGSRYDLCTLCGVKANETVIAAIGHNFTTFREKDPTCVDDGYRIYTCANGCGGTLTIYWNSSEADLAQAKKLKENSDNEWVSITADDVEHLKATGEHTYAKVQDEDGKDTGVDAWIIDKEATCSVTGSKHKDCIKCGARETEEIPLDETAHKFYRAKVAQNPTCTEEGWKNATCKYCGYVDEKVEMIPALGHTEGEYRIITPATCEEDGEKVLTCSVCECDIGEADKDGKYAEEPVTVKIDKLNHKWVIDGDPYQKDGEEGKWYQDYKCANGCGETDTRETEYAEKVEATVTFISGDDDENTQVITKYIGETISATDVIAPTKAADDTYKYTFRAWATRTGEGTEESPYVYTDVNYPIEVKGEATYYARYDEKYVNYTITYYAEDGTQIDKKGYLHNGDEVKLANGPKKAQTAIDTYEFAGWEVIGSDPKVVYSDKLTIDGANINLKATYKAAKRIYSVTYAITMSEIIQTTTVTAGEAAPAFLGMDAEGSDPTKKHDTGYHYEFTGWDKAEQMKKVESNIYTTPVFEKAEHSFTVSVKSEASCIQNRVEIKACDNCDYSYEYEVPNTRLDHLFDENIFEIDEQGNKVYKCQRENCDAIKTEEDAYTVNFYKEDGTTVHAQRFDIKWGASLADIIKSVNAPEKAKDNEYIYTFDCWKIKNSDGTYADVAGATVKADMNLVATFNKADRLYTVIFAYDASNVISHITGKKYGEIGTALYNGATPKKAYDESATGNHYEFSTWKLNSIDTKNDAYYYYAQFNEIKHTFVSGGRVEANCQHGASELMKCVCGYSYTVESGKPLAHTYEVVENIPATPDKAGKITYKCSVCGDTYSEDIAYVDPTEGFVTITVTVRDNKGNLVQGAKVDLYKLNGSQVGAYVTGDYTKSNGVATFKVEKGSYHVIISGVKNADTVSFNTTANGDGEVSGVPTIKIKDCSCACHNDNLWGKIFRFFHTIIKWITGEFKCCKDPSDLY